MLEKSVFHVVHLNTLFNGTTNGLHHAFTSTVSADNDTYHLREMLKQPDKIWMHLRYMS